MLVDQVLWHNILFVLFSEKIRKKNVFEKCSKTFDLIAEYYYFGIKTKFF